MMIAFGVSSAMALPDLVPVASSANAYVSTENFAPTSCAVDEGCTTAGLRRLLRFTAYTKNVGASDLVMGSPVGNPLFEFHACHGHYHFHDYLTMRLVTTTGTVVGAIKQSFCLLDSIRHDPLANVSPVYNCSNQGLQAGWGDIYSSTLDCQYVDITGVPAGDYVLEMHVNPEEILTESDYSNNISTVSVTINEATPVPENDLCANAIQPQIELVPLTGSTESATVDGQSCGSSAATRDVWFRYVPYDSGTAKFSMCGSDYDTVLSIHSACPGNTGNMLACNDDSSNPDCGDPQDSFIQMNVTAGTPYLVRVSGYLGATGVYRLVIDGPGPSAAEHWDFFM